MKFLLITFVVDPLLCQYIECAAGQRIDYDIAQMEAMSIKAVDAMIKTERKHRDGPVALV